ncbi:MAG: DrmB family protein [Desulfomonilaceae bacterium]
MKDENTPVRVGEVRPNQMLYTYGVGSIVELPNISVLVMGLGSWDASKLRTIHESRLLRAVKNKLSDSVERLVSLPRKSDDDATNPLGESFSTVGAPVAVFPRWLRCISCGVLADVDSGLFKLIKDVFHPDRIRFEHVNCSQGAKRSVVVPSRFLVACPSGHLDDFPWIDFVHGSSVCEAPSLKLKDSGLSGQTTDVWVECACGKSRQMSQAFDTEDGGVLPKCTGRHPHLINRKDDCNEQSRAMLLGASNSWFPDIISIFSIPTSTDRLKQIVDKNWDNLVDADCLTTLKVLRKSWIKNALMPELKEFSDEELWEAIEAKKNQAPDEAPDQQDDDLKIPEWKVFSNPEHAPESDDLKLSREPVPSEFGQFFERVTLGYRLREVTALIGFTRIEAPGESLGGAEQDFPQNGPLTSGDPEWVPAGEVKGEGIFLQFREDAIQGWTKDREVRKREHELLMAWIEWRKVRKLEPYNIGFLGARYVLLHSFSHAFMRELALECGYAAASMRERIYSAYPDEEGGPMAGVLVYTAASDSEGTLGGLVSLGRTETLGRLIHQALDKMKFCSSDPLCAEHEVRPDGKTLHGSACHACLFAPETSCERGNRLLDRGYLVETLDHKGMEFFAT